MIVCNQVMKFILDKIDKDERQAAKKRKREESVEQKRTKQNASKLSALLFKHKEQLKADILKKRALLDKELQLQVQVRGKQLNPRRNAAMLKINVSCRVCFIIVNTVSCMRLAFKSYNIYLEYTMLIKLICAFVVL